VNAWIARWRTSAAGRWLDALEPRDRAIVVALAAAVVATLLFLGIWQPVASWSSAQNARYERQVAILDWMRANEAAARAAGQQDDGSGNTGGSLLTLVANTAASAGIQLTRYQPDAGGGVSVVLQGQDFNAMLQWLAAMQAQRQVRVRQMSVDAQGDPGKVNARLNLM
jgi:type II secretory pathway component PulM